MKIKKGKYIGISIFLLIWLGNLMLFSPFKDESSKVCSLKPSTGEISIITPENKTYYNAMSGYYPASYGFENDRDGSFPTGWSVLDAGGTANIISELDGHKKVLEIHDTSALEMEIINSFTDKTNGTIEFFIRCANNTKRTKFFIYDEEDTDAVYLYFDNDGYIKYYDTVTHNIMQYNSSQWYHLKIEWDCAVGDWYLWIDGISQDSGSGYNLRGNPTALDTLYIGTTTTEQDFYSYIDAVGYSWDPNYEIGDNLEEGLLLSFESSIDSEWMGYSFDGQTNKTILGNSTIPMSNYGIHTIQVFGNETSGTMYSSELRYFTTHLPEFHIDKQIAIGSSEPFDPESIKFKDGIYDETTFGGGFGEVFHREHADTVIEYMGDTYGTTDNIGIAQVLRDPDNKYLWVGTSDQGYLKIKFGYYSDISYHQYLKRIDIVVRAMADSFLDRDPGSGLTVVYYDNNDNCYIDFNNVIESLPEDEVHYTHSVHLDEDDPIFNNVKSGGYIKSIEVYMYSYASPLNPVWLNVDFVDIYYIFDKPDINFEYQFNCSEYGFENIIEFDVNLDIMETVGDLNINFWNFETSQWDNINQIPSSGFYSYNIDSSADDYFDNDELFILGFEQNDYWDGRPYTNYKIKIDFIQIKIPPPDPPPNLIAYQTPFQICLRWDDSYTYGAPVLYYNIYKNESEGGEMKLIATSSNTEFNDSEVEVGIIYYGISAYSHMGESNTSNIEFMFQDIADPVWNPEPEDQTIELGDPFIYEVNADDLSEVYYSINDTIHFAINSGTGLITNAIVLSVGKYWLEITAEDPYGHAISTVIKITVEDTINPEWNPDPEDQTIELGDPFNYEVNADDLSGVIYSINDTTHFGINSGTGLITNAITLSVGEYWLEITAEDPYGHAITTVIKITVEDTTDPVWNPDPEDQTIELGDPFNYEVNADDLSGVIYSINDTTHFAINSGTGLITNAIALSVGEYWLEITAEDPYGNVISATIKITVEKSTSQPPAISGFEILIISICIIITWISILVYDKKKLKI